MKAVTINVPDSLDMEESDVNLLVASRLYETGKLSLGEAAEMAGLTKPTFAELLSHYNVSLFNYPVSDLKKDVQNA